MKPTIKAIAEAAKVSRGTVDKVLNDRQGVSLDVRERVKKIAEDIGYKPNLAGKALAFQKNPIKIGIIILNKYDPLFEEVHKGVLQAIQEYKDFGVSLEIRMMENVTVEEQLRCIHELQMENIAALSLSPLEEEVIKCELNRLVDNNIKIITFNTDISKVERLCFIGQNLVQSGRVAGELMGKLLPAGGEIAILSGPTRIKALQDRIIGFREIIESEHKSLKIIDVQENIIDNRNSYDKTMEVVNKHKSLKGIFVTGSGVGGLGKALKELARTDIKIICFDITPETVELIKNRTIDFTITQEPFMQGYLPIKVLFEYFFKNQNPSGNKIYTKLQIVTKENIEN